MRARSVTRLVPSGMVTIRYRFFHSSVAPAPAQWIAPRVQAMPRPRKTFTLFEPVTLPTEASANGSAMAAVFEANLVHTFYVAYSVNNTLNEEP